MCWVRGATVITGQLKHDNHGHGSHYLQTQIFSSFSPNIFVCNKLHAAAGVRGQILYGSSPIIELKLHPYITDELSNPGFINF